MIDFNLAEGAPTKNNDIELIMQQIDMLFDTYPGEVFGDETYGTKYDHYLYKLNASPISLQSLVTRDLNSLELFGFKPKVEVLMFQGTERDIILINIELKRDFETYNKSYKIS